MDARIVIALLILEINILDLLADAKVTDQQRHGRFSRMWEKINAALLFLVLAIYAVWGVIDSSQLNIVFRPDRVVNATVDTDAPFVLSEFQTTVDLMLVFVIERLVQVAMVAHRNQPEEFVTVVSPITPKHVVNGVEVQSRRAENDDAVHVARVANDSHSEPAVE